jgi:hypothetical protein
MDGRLFDEFLRDFANSRRSLLGTALAAAAAITGFSATAAKKKKKKPCKKKCKTGCCTSKYGKCIKREQQSSTQCGTAGEICRTNCEGLERCGPATCDGCCDGATCEISSAAHCGRNGIACIACDAQEDCGSDGRCCGLQGHTCGSDENCCLNRLCDGGKCCSVVSGACGSDPDCCNPDHTICEDGQCRIRSGMACEPLQMCQGGFLCPGASSLFRCCSINGGGCTVDHDCCEDEDTCDGGICKRRVGDFCDETIICRDRYPHCVQGACRRCLDGQISTGSDEICCPSDRYCPNANEGRGACCEHVGCCLPDEDGVACGLREHVGEGQCGTGEYPPEH